jgi:hypothetical protein
MRLCHNSDCHFDRREKSLRSIRFLSLPSLLHKCCTCHFDRREKSFTIKFIRFLSRIRRGGLRNDLFELCNKLCRRRRSQAFFNILTQPQCAMPFAPSAMSFVLSELLTPTTNDHHPCAPCPMRLAPCPLSYPNYKPRLPMTTSHARHALCA